MSCRWIEDHAEELAAEQSPPHLAECADCARAWDRTQAVMRRALVDVEPAPISPELQRRIARSLAGHDPRTGRRVAIGAGIAAVAAACIFAFWVSGRAPKRGAQEAPPDGTFERAENAVAIGWLELDIAPPARLSVDGEDRGTVARTKLKLRAGTHELKLRAAGVTTAVTVEIRAGETTLLRRDLRAR